MVTVTGVTVIVTMEVTIMPMVKGMVTVTMLGTDTVMRLLAHLNHRSCKVSVPFELFIKIIFSIVFKPSVGHLVLRREGNSMGGPLWVKDQVAPETSGPTCIALSTEPSLTSMNDNRYIRMLATKTFEKISVANTWSL